MTTGRTHPTELNASASDPGSPQYSSSAYSSSKQEFASYAVPDSESSPSTPPANLITCPQCGATKIAKSRSHANDRMTMLLLPKRPYRCLRCYHRFWHKEEFADDPRRIKAWLLILGLVVVIIAWQLIKLGGASENGAASSDVKVGSGLPSIPAGNESTARTMIEASGFQPPRSAETEIVQLAQAGVSRAEIRDKLNAAHVLSVSADESLEQPVPSQLDGAKPEADALSLASEGNWNSVPPAASSAAQNQQTIADQERRISTMLEQWRRAWEMGDSDRYLEFYSPNFSPRSGISRERWQRQRRERVVPSKQIELTITDIEIDLDSEVNNARVRFQQDYRSANYTEASIKELQLNRIANQWYISGEVER